MGYVRFKILCQRLSQSKMLIQSPLEMDCQLREDQVPALHRMGPTFGGLQYTGIEQFEYAVFAGKAPLDPGQFAELAMNYLDCTTEAPETGYEQ